MAREIAINTADYLTQADLNRAINNLYIYLNRGSEVAQAALPILECVFSPRPDVWQLPTKATPSAINLVREWMQAG